MKKRNNVKNTYSEKNKEKKLKDLKQNFEIKKFKQNYFDFYDDIKDYTRGKEDW